MNSDEQSNGGNYGVPRDIYAKVKYNRPDELAGVLSGAFAQWDAGAEQ